MTRITRFAPSPTGLMHVGNAFSALACQQWAKQHHARFLLRIEDIDFNRCRKEYADAIIEDLSWLGTDWHGDVRRQSEHLPAYQRALKRLRDMEMIYPCFCTRRRIQEEINRMSVAPHAEDTAGLYPGTCRKISVKQQREHMSRQRYAWRLDVAGKNLSWKDGEGHRHAVKSVMHVDAVIGRKDIGISYHLAVVVDDAAQGITHVIRTSFAERTCVLSPVSTVCYRPCLIFRNPSIFIIRCCVMKLTTGWPNGMVQQRSGPYVRLACSRKYYVICYCILRTSSGMAWHRLARQAN